MDNHHSAPDKPQGWSMTDEGYIQVERTDYYGVKYLGWEKPAGATAGELWKAFMATRTWVGSGSVVSSWIDRERVKIMIENKSI